jgi:hypothetical protein
MKEAMESHKEPLIEHVKSRFGVMLVKRETFI